MSNDSHNVYWKSPEQRFTSPVPGDEFASIGQRAPFSRRDFIKAAGFSVFTTTLAGCGRGPVNKIIPYLNAPDGPVPGSAVFYASVCTACEAGCGTLIKVLDGRPIKLEGLPAHPLSRGGLCAIGQASLLGLYDSQRFQQPLLNGQPATWETVDATMTGKLAEWRRDKTAVRFLTRTTPSPTTRAVIQRFVDSFPNARLVMYDPFSSSAIADAHQQTHGARMLPRYRFEKARVIVSFGADFLGTWISPVEHAAGYTRGRRLDDQMSYHVQLESCLSLTGSNADRRYRLAPDDTGAVLTQLAGALAQKAGVPFVAPLAGHQWDELAERLWQARGHSLVVCGEQDLAAQLLVNFINDLLGNYGQSVDLSAPSLQKQGDDRALAELQRELAEGTVGVLFIADINPVHDLPDFGKALDKVNFIVNFSQRADETTARAHVICAEHNEFESWSDAEPVSGVMSIRQPVIAPRGRTRAMIESLTAWLGEPLLAYDIVRTHWQRHIVPRHPDASDKLWNTALEAGFIEVAPVSVTVQAFNRSAVKPVTAAEHGGAFTLVGYAKVGLGDGRHAYNPWLQELPDPVSKVTWDNYASLSMATAAKLGVVEGDVVRIEAGAETVQLPAYVQPGQHDDVVAVAVGYGQQSTARFAKIGPQWFEGRLSVGSNGLVGVNVAPLFPATGDYRRPTVGGVRLVKTGRRWELAATQTYQYITVPEKLAPANGLVRPCIQETTLAAFQQNPAAGIEKHHLPKDDLYPPDHPYPGRQWAMVIDLTRCTGCSACVVACQAENNIPTVGRDEVRRRREMHWLRIDRYYKGDADEVTVAHQPMLCQQCENAPCESVCPVLATVHTEEGLNAQVYNRCVGTRYCENNCPYKVRRFNWFNYRHDDPVENLVLNPNVVVRSRGVMEKCSFCVQRIQEATIVAKGEGKLPADGVIQTACQQSCPVQAIVFGDRNDPKSVVTQARQNPRHYHVLEELNIRPAVGYLTLVRDRPAAKKETSHH